MSERMKNSTSIQQEEIKAIKVTDSNEKHLIHAKSGLKILEKKFRIEDVKDPKVLEQYFEMNKKLKNIESSEDEEIHFESLQTINQVLGRINVALIQAAYTENK